MTQSYYLIIFQRTQSNIIKRFQKNIIIIFACLCQILFLCVFFQNVTNDDISDDISDSGSEDQFLKNNHPDTALAGATN